MSPVRFRIDVRMHVVNISNHSRVTDCSPFLLREEGSSTLPKERTFSEIGRLMYTVLLR